MARKVGQIIARGERTWLVRIYLGRDPETRKRKYHNRTIHGPVRQAQVYLTKRLRERDLGRGIEGTQVTLNEYLDRWLQTAAKPRLREKIYDDYEGMLRCYVRPAGREAADINLATRDSKRLPADDRSWPIRSDGPVHACCAAFRAASGVEMGVVVPRSPHRRTTAAGITV